MKVLFLETRTVKAVAGETFEKGKLYDLPEPSAERWIRRNVARPVSDAEAAEIEAAAKVAEGKVSKKAPKA